MQVERQCSSNSISGCRSLSQLFGHFYRDRRGQKFSRISILSIIAAICLVLAIAISSCRFSVFFSHFRLLVVIVVVRTDELAIIDYRPSPDLLSECRADTLHSSCDKTVSGYSCSISLYTTISSISIGVRARV